MTLSALPGTWEASGASTGTRDTLGSRSSFSAKAGRGHAPASYMRIRRDSCFGGKVLLSENTDTAATLQTLPGLPAARHPALAPIRLMGWTCKDDTKPRSDALAVFLQDKGSKKPRVTNHWKSPGGIRQVALLSLGSSNCAEKVKMSITASSNPQKTLCLELHQRKGTCLLCQSARLLLWKMGCHPRSPSPRAHGRQLSGVGSFLSNHLLTRLP